MSGKILSTIEEKFWRSVDKRTDEECWNWTKSLTVRGGYGQFTHKRKLYKAHRVSYMLHHGEIPKGLFICHTCDNPKCCNPSHLYAGSPAQNWHDCKARNRAYVFEIRSGVDASSAKLTEEAVLEIRNSEYPSKFFMNKYGISRSTVCSIRRGKTWKKLTVMS